MSHARPLALAHLLVRLRPLHRALRVAVALRDATTTRMRDAGAVADAISRGHADAILDDVGDLVHHRALSAGPAIASDDELASERAVRDDAAAAAVRLPIDALGDDLDLDDFERETLVLCAAAELDTGFEHIFGFLHDDAGRRRPSVELVCALTSPSLAERLARRTALGPWGRLRRLGLVSVVGVGPSPGGLRDELHLTPAALEALLGAPIDHALVFHDPADVPLEPSTPGDDLVQHTADALAAQRIDVVAIWGRPRTARDLVVQLAARTGTRLRRYPVNGVDPPAAAAAAAALGALLWIDLDALDTGPAPASTRDLLDVCCRTRVPLVLTGSHAWRPPELVAARHVVELPATDLDHAGRRALWRIQLPELSDNQLAPIAAGFRFDPVEIRAAARMARATAALRTNGHPMTAGDTLREACTAVARKHGERHTTFVTPRRGPDDLILPPELHARILDLAHDFRAMPRVMDDWGFARRVSGGGVKALFTGDSGTGKTLAAEVVAAELGLPLLKVDLARVVSKWIGETEKHLDIAFTEAHDSHAVLFFDEAEALFGARGDVRHAADRYANLEVSYLLQRLEDHSGIVILATNLRDKIDPAFIRRFHAVIGFPRPGEKQRHRMWQRVLPPQIPRDGDLDLAALSRIDLTGAGIVGAAQTAAFLAAREDAPLAMRHVIRGLVRQFQRESRVLTAHDLGPHAVHIDRPHPQ